MDHETRLERADRFGASRIPDGMSVSGTIDMATWSALADALATMAECHAASDRIVLDLSKVAFVDSHGVSLIVDAARALGPAQRLVVRGAPPTMLRIVEILNLKRESRLAIEGPA